MEANGGAWSLIAERQNAQGRRLDTVENALMAHSAQALRVEEKTDARLANLERDMASIKTTLRIVAGAIAFLCPVFTAVLVKVVG